MLYLTVLGFDSITIGFCKASGVEESFLGILLGVSSGFGFLGSISFPVLRSKIGLCNTAFLGISLLMIFDGLCVTSVFLPGSKFLLSSNMTDILDDISEKS